MASDPDPRQRLDQLARWHDEWVAKHAATTPFPPGQNVDDDGSAFSASQFYVDMEASQEAQDEFMMRAREIMGLDPVTGLPLDSGK